MPDTTFPDWVKVGAEVAIVQAIGWGSSYRVTRTTIDRLTATQIIVGERKFKARGGEVVDMKRTSDWRGGDSMLAASDPRVAEYEEIEALERRQSVAYAAVDRWIKSRNDRELAREAAAALLRFASTGTPN